MTGSRCSRSREDARAQAGSQESGQGCFRARPCTAAFGGAHTCAFLQRRRLGVDRHSLCLCIPTVPASVGKRRGIRSRGQATRARDKPHGPGRVGECRTCERDPQPDCGDLP